MDANFVFFVLGVLTLGCFYAMLAVILNFVAGWGGMADLGVAGLVAVACYTYVITTQTAVTDDEILFAPGLPIGAGIILSGAVTAAVALVIGLPTLRLRGEYFLITTLAFAEVIRQVLLNTPRLTRGTIGFSQVERPFSAQMSGRDYRIFLLVLVVVVLAALILLMRRISRSPYGRMTRATRDNESVAVSLGKNVTRHRITAFVFAGLLVGLIAPIYMWHIRSLVPSLFSADLTFTVWTALVIGGIGSRIGPVFGGVFLIAITESFTFFQGSAENAQLLAALRPVLLGTVLILALRFRPQGVFTERAAFHKPRKKKRNPAQRQTKKVAVS